MTFTVKTVFTSQQIADLVVTAFEGGSNYWIRKVDLSAAVPGLIGHERYSRAEAYEKPFTFVVTTDEGDPFAFTRAAIQRGLDVMSREYPRRVSSILSEDFDADDGDVFLQCCLFGQVVYG